MFEVIKPVSIQVILSEYSVEPFNVGVLHYINYDEKIKQMLEYILNDVEIIERNTRGLDVKALKKELTNYLQKCWSQCS